MTVGELIEKLSTLPPNTLVCTEAEIGLDGEPDAYALPAHVELVGNSIFISNHWGGRSGPTETVVLISQFGQDETAVKL